MAIPPAWTDVWICASPQGHIQAIGYDQRGRKQYRYHPHFREVRDSAKFEHLVAFAEALPALRKIIDADMRRPGVGRDKVLAAVVHLLETTMIRVGNPAYAKANKTFGLTTLHSRHVTVAGDELKFHFTGKSGRSWRLGVHDRRVARIVKRCQDLPGQHLFQYLDEGGERRSVNSTDINAYLRAKSGRDITAKDFRTWTGTVLAATRLSELGSATPGARRSNLSLIIREVAARLGNTPTICRRCYIHPAIVQAYLGGQLWLEVPAAAAGNGARRGTHFAADEAAVLAFLRRRLTRRSPPQGEKTRLPRGLDRPKKAGPGPAEPTQTLAGLSGSGKEIRRSEPR